MGTPSSRPGPAVHAPAPLRAKGLPRSFVRIPQRYEARSKSAELLDLEARKLGIPNGALGRHMGGERAGAMLRAGGMAADPGEAALLYPLSIAIAYMTHLIGERLRREQAAAIAANDNDTDLRVGLAMPHLDAIRSLFCRRRREHA